MPRSPSKKPPSLAVPSQNNWQIAKLVPGGAGFLRLDNGQSAFAPGALPGERIDVQQVADHGGYVQATRWSLLEASPDRVQPVCPVQRECGGCDWMTLSYTAQLAAKVELLRDALTRTGRFGTLPEITFVASEQPLAYRSRVRLHASEGRLGFFAADSNELVEIPACAVAHPDLNSALVTLRAIAAQHAQALAAFSELELRVAPAGPRLALRLLPSASPNPRSAALVEALQAELSVSVGERGLGPEHDQRFPLPGGVELRAPNGAFTQVNWPLNQRLVRAVLDGAERRSVTTFCDLYCGAGNFSLPLAAAGVKGVGIESSQQAVAAADLAAHERGLPLRFVSGDVRSAFADLRQAERFDLVVLDPPRSGARDILPELIRRAPEHIAYCACDPVTLARDLRTLSEAGYALEELTGFDMFPQTHHFETLAWLTRGPRT